jgi:hypothetical protein
MFTIIQNQILDLKAEATELGISMYGYNNSTIIDYKDPEIIADEDIRMYLSFTYSEMLGEFTRKIIKKKIANKAATSKAFLDLYF